MKTTKILISAIIFFALNVNSFAADQSDDLLNSLEINKNEVTFALNKNGRNQHVRIQQDITEGQLVTIESNEVISQSMNSKGRNIETLNSIKENNVSYATTGRNKRTLNEMISMN